MERRMRGAPGRRVAPERGCCHDGLTTGGHAGCSGLSPTRWLVRLWDKPPEVELLTQRAFFRHSYHCVAGFDSSFLLAPRHLPCAKTAPEGSCCSGHLSDMGICTLVMYVRKCREIEVCMLILAFQMY